MNIREDESKEKLFVDGLNAFNNGKFYDAHEFWEDLWSDYILVDAKFIQALIQLSVGYFHISNFNKNGAIGLLTKSINKFELYPSRHRQINVKLILDSIGKSLLDLNNIKKIEDFNWNLVPEIKISNE